MPVGLGPGLPGGGLGGVSLGGASTGAFGLAMIRPSVILRK